MNKISEFRDLTIDELQKKLLTLRKEQFDMRFKRAAGVLNQTHLISKLKRSIAQIKTIMSEKEKNRSES